MSSDNIWRPRTNRNPLHSRQSVVSIPRECRNPRGQTIVIADDHLRQSLAPNTPVVIIAPGYGQTALDASTLSYYLAHHRLRVLRYDHTNHVGLSGGELQQTTLRSMQADLLKVVEFVQHTVADRTPDRHGERHDRTRRAQRWQRNPVPSTCCS